MSKREKILISVLVFVLLVAAYFFLFLSPTLGEHDRLNTEIERVELLIVEAQARQQRYAMLTIQIEELLEAIRNLPPLEELIEIPILFDHNEALRRIQRVFYPQTDFLTITFASNELSRELPGIYVHSINVNFTASYTGLIAVLQGLIDDGPALRIVDYMISNVAEEGIGPLTVRMTIEYLARLPAEIEDEDEEAFEYEGSMPQ